MPATSEEVAASEPGLAVLWPLEDTRGGGADYLQSWLHQSLERARYQIVVACSGDDPEVERLVAAQLGPHDVIVRAPHADLIALYNAAAAAATAPWLVMTESHCIADPGCLEAVAAALDGSPGLGAATLTHAHLGGDGLQHLGDHWFDEIHEVWAAREWQQLRALGSVIRRAHWQEVGGLEGRFGLFSIPLFSARLHERGVRVGHVGAAIVSHVMAHTLREHHDHSADYARGECEARKAYDIAFCERYFGHSTLWANARRFEAATARQACRALAATLGRALTRNPRDVPWLGRELLASVPAALAGVEPYRLRARAVFTAAELATAHLPLPARIRGACFRWAQDAVVRLTRLEWVREQRGELGPAGIGIGAHAASDLAPGAVVGAHGLERIAERSFRWTESVATYLVARGAGRRTVSIQTGGIRAAPARCIAAVYVDGRRIDSDGLGWHGDTLSVRLPPGDPDHAPIRVTVLSRPLRPVDTQEERSLGLPVLSVEVREGARRGSGGGGGSSVARLERATLVNTSDHGGGAELIAMTLLDGFNAAGTETYLAVGSKQTADPRVVPLFLSRHVDYRSDSVWHRRARRAARTAIDRQLGREDFNHPHSRSILELTGSRPDLVLCDNLHGGFFDLRVLPWLSRQVPVVLMLHDAWLFTGHCAMPPGCGRWETGCGACPALDAPPAVKRDATRSNWERKRRILAASSLYVIARSEWMLEQAERSILADAIVEANVIPGGVDLDIFRPGPRDEARRAIGVDQDATLLLYVANRGRLGAHKDFGALRAATTLLAREPRSSNCELIVVGQAGEAEEIAPGMRIRHLPRCEPRDLSTFYRAADLFVHASAAEAYGLTAAEALACGLPVVAASQGGIHEVVEQGRTGVIVPPGDARALASAISALLDDPARRREMSERALAHARPRFDRDAMVKETHAWCADIASRWRGANVVAAPLRAGRWRRYETNGLARVAAKRLAAIDLLERERGVQARAAQERLAALEQVSLERDRLAGVAQALRTRVEELEGRLRERATGE